MWFAKDLRVKLVPLVDTSIEIRYAFIGVKFGNILLGASNSGRICILYFVLKDEATTLMNVRKKWPKAELIADPTLAQIYSKRLFESGRQNGASMHTMEVAVHGTKFQIDVWNALVSLEEGCTCTYSELANMINRPKAVRAVASAVAQNEVSILIPCHRCVSKNGQVKYGWGEQLKRDLLSYETTK